MNLVLPLPFIVALSLPSSEPDTGEARALAVLRKLNAQVTVDEKAPGRPVIAVNL